MMITFLFGKTILAARLIFSPALFLPLGTVLLRPKMLRRFESIRPEYSRQIEYTSLDRRQGDIEMPKTLRPRYVDLSHTIENGMITYKGFPGPKICDFMSREASKKFYQEGTSFQIGKIEMIANTGTYVDSPFHRFEDGEDISELRSTSSPPCRWWWCEWITWRDAQLIKTRFCE